MTSLVRWLQWLALALWLGGIVGIGALSAPAAFETIRHARATAGLAPADQNALAGAIVGTALRHFNALCTILLLVLIGGALLERVRPGRGPRSLAVGRIGVVLLLAACHAALMAGLLPAMDAAQAAGQMARFDRLHHLYEDVAYAEMVVLAALAALFTALDRPPSTA